jgi:hypothetical protein
MQRLIEKHSVGLIFGVLFMMVAGYIDMRSIAGSMNENLVKVVNLAEITREEQLLRSDEIEWVQEMRREYPGTWSIKKK